MIALMDSYWNIQLKTQSMMIIIIKKWVKHCMSSAEVLKFKPATRPLCASVYFLEFCSKTEMRCIIFYLKCEHHLTKLLSNSEQGQ